VSPGEATPHLWAHGAAVEEFERARPLLAALLHHQPRYRLLLTARDRALRRRLRAAFPEATVAAPPVPSAWRVRRALGRLRPHVLLLLERPHDLGRPVFERARWWRFPVILVDGAAPALAGAAGALLGAIDHFLLRDPAAAEMLRARGIATDAITVAAPPPGARPVTSAGWAPPLSALVARDWARLGTPRPRGIGGWAPRLLDSPLGRRALGLRARRIETLEALRDRLGAPGTILCLGNGPSSEDPRLLTMEFDVLFRVNCRWAGRGGHDRPHVVFTGDTQCLGAAGEGVLAFRTVEEERRLLGRHLVRRTPWRLTYVTVERVPVPIAPVRARPTNGAVMVATAVALAPRRLVIAGIDLFEHPAGAYPGDSATPNAYLLMHDRETELDILAGALRAFAGDLVVLWAPLARALEARGIEGRAVAATEATAG
jgi:3-Deoxy-D-manno-octulosonic-acid transferase (kdotransferase)